MSGEHLNEKFDKDIIQFMNMDKNKEISKAQLINHF